MRQIALCWSSAHAMNGHFARLTGLRLQAWSQAGEPREGAQQLGIAVCLALDTAS